MKYIIYAFALLIFLLPENVMAQQNKPAPTVEKYQIHDEATFNSLTEIKKVTPFSKAHLEFFILIPKDWETLPISADEAGSFTQRIIGDVARFQSPVIGIHRAKVTVQYLNIDTEIDARNWLRNRILSLGYAPDGDIAVANPYRAAAAYATVGEDGSKYVYATAVISGNAVFLVTFELPLRLKDYMGYVQKKTVDSFVLKSAKQDPVEPQIEYTFKDALKFSYPQSWKVASQAQGKQQQNLQLINQRADSSIDGFIQFNLIKRRNDSAFQNEVKKLSRYFHDVVGVNIKELKTTDLKKAPTSSGDRFAFNRYEIYRVEDNKKESKKPNPRDLHFVALGDTDWYIFTFMMTPTEEQNFQTNARNVRSFERVLESMQ